MSTFYMAALVVASIFWLGVIVWLIAGSIAKRKAMPKKQLIANKEKSDHKIGAQTTAGVNTH